jgi:hypothetical protein
MSVSKKLKLGVLTPISGEWFNLHKDKIELCNDIKSADYILYESNGDPIQVIEKVKRSFPSEKLVFILSGDQNAHIENSFTWFTNAVLPDGLVRDQTQIYVTNPAIFKFYDNLLKGKEIRFGQRGLDIYFKGTIWQGMRTEMYDEFFNKPRCEIINNSNYWNWRFSAVRPTQKQLEDTAFDSYRGILNAKLCLCPKGNGNSSMRIIEALACESVPVLINDFSEPFGVKWGGNEDSNMDCALIFDTKKQSWREIYDECQRLINDVPRYTKMVERGRVVFKEMIYCDSKLDGFKMYSDINTVCFGFSKLIVDKLINIKNEKDKMEKVIKYF